MLDEAILHELNKFPKNSEEAIKNGFDYYFRGDLCAKGHLSLSIAGSRKCLECKKERIHKIYLNCKFDFITKEEYEELSKLPKSEKEALKAGIPTFFTGIPCKRGHWSARGAANGSCRKCASSNSQLRWQNSSEEEKQQKRDKENARNADRRDHRNALQRAARARNLKETRRKRNEYMRKKRNDPLYKIHASMTTGIYHSLKNYGLNKNKAKWESFVTYTLDDLIKHLEKQFTDDMNWGNYGKYWHIDHIKPKSLCKDFDECWALENLQPLKIFDNLSKGNKYIGHPDNPQWINKSNE